MARLKQEKQTLEDEKKDLQSKGGDTSNLQKQVLELVEKIAQNELYIAALESKETNGATKEAIEKIQQQFEADIQKNKEQNETDKTTIAALQQTIAEHKASISEASEREGQYKIEKAQDQITIQAHEKTITEEQRKYGELVGQSLTDNGKFNARIKDLEQKIGEDTATLAARDKLIETQVKKIQEDEKSIQDLQGQHGQDQKTIQDLQGQHGQDQKTIQDLQGQHGQHKKTIADQTQKLLDIVNDNQKKMDEQKAIVAADKLTIQRQEKELIECERQKKYYVQEYTTKNAELVTMTQSRDKLQAQIDGFSAGTSTQVLQKQITDLTHEKGEVDKKYALLEVEKDDLKRTIDKLTAEINSLQTQLKNSSTSSHVQGTSVNVKILTEKERQDELKKVHATLMDKLLKQLIDQVKFPVHK